MKSITLPAIKTDGTQKRVHIQFLSTIGIISFGLALVAGKKRVPIPAAGKTALAIFLI